MEQFPKETSIKFADLQIFPFAAETVLLKDDRGVWTTMTTLLERRP